MFFTTIHHKREEYVSPVLDSIKVRTEKGFASSLDGYPGDDLPIIPGLDI